MVRKLVLASIGLIVCGLALIIISDTALRVVTGAAGFPRTAGNFTSGQFFGNFTSSQFSSVRRAAGVSAVALESLAGIGLVGAGLLLEIFSVLLGPGPTRPKV